MTGLAVYARSLRDICIVVGLDLYDAIPRRTPVRTSRTILAADEDAWTDGSDF